MASDQFHGHNHHQQHQHQMINQIHGFDERSNNPTDHQQHHYNHQIFGSNSNMGMMIDFSRHHQTEITSGMDHHHYHHQTSGSTVQNQLLEDSSSSMRLCNVNNNFSSEVNDERPTQRPSQGLSLSLSSSNPTSISLQSFDLRHQQQGYSGKSTDHQNLPHSQMMMLMNSHHQNNSSNHHQFQIGSSKYLSAAQELLSEFCSLGVKESDDEVMMKHKRKQKGKQQEDWDASNNNNDQHDQSATTSSKKHVPPLHSLEFMELQKRKAKLLAMLEEVYIYFTFFFEQPIFTLLSKRFMGSLENLLFFSLVLS